MKKIIAVILAALLILGLGACSAAKKPQTPQNRTMIVPEATRVTFDAVDLKKAPKVVRDIAKTLEKRDAAAWAQAEGKAYLIISQGNRTSNYDLKVDDVMQRMPDQGFTWLDVTLAYKRGETSGDGGTPPVITVFRADLNTPPGGAGFTVTGLGSPGRPEATRPAAPPAAPGAAAGVAISQPAPGQEITSPVKVQGTARGQGQMRVRISTRGGQIIKEENLSPAPGTGAFSLQITYSPPEMPAPGEISIISTGGGEEKVLARVPVVIK